MDPYHLHQQHRRLNHGQQPSSPFDTSPLASWGQPHVQPIAGIAASTAPLQTGPGPGPGPGPPHAIQHPLQTHFTPSYDSESTSPVDVGASGTDSFVQAYSSSAHMAPSSRSTPNPKRAYRQRRKDPSCDACRERKVKCDATETASCSECSSRNVRCQFTKETNRRMSSIKQFQDLERQLQQARQQLAQFQSIMPKGILAMDTELDSPPHHGPNLQSLGSPPRTKWKPAVKTDFSQVRMNLKDYGRGLLQIPSAYQEPLQPTSQSSKMTDLPPKYVAQRFLTSYRDNFHTQFPIMDWHAFEAECDQLYRTTSLASLGSAWGAVFLSVLACGTLYTLDPGATVNGKAFLSAAIGLTNLWQEDFSIEKARLAFLTGVFLVEMNLKPAGWVWLGSAVRISQHIGLHHETGQWPFNEGEMRRRLWYCIYAWDRLLAFELGKPLFLHEEDHEIDFPESTDEDQNPNNNNNNGMGSGGPSTPLLAMVTIARSFQSLVPPPKSTFVTRERLQVCEEYLHTFFSLLPKTFRPSALEALAPQTIAPLVCLQNARLLLQRHNLTPSCTADLRLEAIDKCVLVARDTAMILSRCLDPALSPTQEAAERSRMLAISASTFLCMHIWRCLLYLLFRADYLPALVLVQAASAIGGARGVNGCCGRHVDFFLGMLYARRQQGRFGDLDHDEEMIAYVSGDLQSNSEISWVWKDKDRGLEGRNQTLSGQALPPPSDHGGSPGSWEKIRNAEEADQEAREWDGWDHVERRVKYLHEQQQQQVRLPPTPRPGQQPASSSPPSDTSRMTIANII